VGVVAGLSLGIKYLRTGHAQHVSDAHSRATGLTPSLPKGGSTSSSTTQHLKEEATHLSHAVLSATAAKGGEGTASAGTAHHHHHHDHHHDHLSAAIKPVVVDGAVLTPITTQTHQAITAIRRTGPRAWPGIAHRWATGAGRSLGRSLQRVPVMLQQGASGAGRTLRGAPGVLKQRAGGAVRVVRTQVGVLGWQTQVTYSIPYTALYADSPQWVV
jgi:hypothetical protein